VRAGPGGARRLPLGRRVTGARVRPAAVTDGAGGGLPSGVPTVAATQCCPATGRAAIGPKQRRFPQRLASVCRKLDSSVCVF